METTTNRCASARDQLPAEIVRKIWSDPSCILAIFAGSSAEFAVNPAAEWLFYTGRLPADPIGRFVSTLYYSRKLFSAPTEEDYRATVREIRGLHTAMEKRRGQAISTDAYVDVLFMNIEYSIRGDELVFGHELNERDRDAIVREFRHFGELMHLPMPRDLREYRVERRAHLATLRVTEWTPKLMKAYRDALGPVRFLVLEIVYGALVDPVVLKLLNLKRGCLSRAFARFYPYLSRFGADRWLIRWSMPARLTRELVESM